MIGLSMASTQIEALITFCSSYGEVFGVIFGSLPSVPRTSKFNWSDFIHCAVLRKRR